MIQIRGDGYTAWEKEDHYFVLLDGPLSSQDRDSAASRAVEALDRREREASSFGKLLATTQRAMLRGACGGLDL